VQPFLKGAGTLLCLQNQNIKRKRLDMAKDKMQMPQSTAGLIRYFDSTKESIKIKPEHVLIASVAIIAAEIIFKAIL